MPQPHASFFSTRAVQKSSAPSNGDELVKFDRPTIYCRKSNQSRLSVKFEIKSHHLVKCELVFLFPYAKKPVQNPYGKLEFYCRVVEFYCRALEFYCRVFLIILKKGPLMSLEFYCRIQRNFLK
jgi:hypothetical protein